jgi:hypothetical protein
MQIKCIFIHGSLSKGTGPESLTERTITVGGETNIERTTLSVFSDFRPISKIALTRPVRIPTPWHAVQPEGGCAVSDSSQAKSLRSRNVRKSAEIYPYYQCTLSNSSFGSSNPPGAASQSGLCGPLPYSGEMGHIPLLSGAFVGLCGRKLALARPQRAKLSPQSPLAKIQYPNLFDGDSVRECGDRFEISPLGSTCRLLWTFSGNERTSAT